MSREFLYTGFATGFSARVKAPFNEVIESQATCSLGATGGYASARVENFRYHEIITFASAHTQVSGVLSEKNAFETLISGVVEGLNIVDMLKADYIVGRLMSKHPVDPPANGPDEPTISPIGSEFGKIRVAGFELTPVINVDLFNKVCGYTDLCKEIGGNKDLRGRWGLPDKNPIPPARGLLVGSIVSEIRGGGPGIEIAGNTVTVPGFGTLHFGEFLISQYERRLVMLRVKLGCPVTLEGSGPDMGGNGIPP